MRNLMISLLMLTGIYAQAGQVLPLNPGQTLMLSNGDVVACMGQAVVPPPVEVKCTLYISGLPPYEGQGYSKEQAERRAVRACERDTEGRNFIDLNKRKFNPCYKNPGTPIWMGFKCK